MGKRLRQRKQTKPEGGLERETSSIDWVLRSSFPI